MYYIDFEYDGKRLSEFDSILCCITDDAGVKTVSIGSNITFNTTYINSSSRFKLMSTQYSEAYTSNFQIAKSTCNGSTDYYTEYEIKYIMRWLNRRKSYKFKPIYENGEFSDVYYNASFNLEEIKLGDKVIGFQLNMNTDAPFGYYEPVEYNFSLNKNEEFNIYDISDEIGWIYPDKVTVECLSDGDLKIENVGKETCIVKNCSSGELINIIGEEKIIESSMESHTRLFNDFNYSFIKIHNDYENNENTFKVSIPCNISIIYSPICKVGAL